jgi:creatinine amidohydrolase
VTYLDYRELTWPEAGALAAAGPTLGIVPLGALEQHGPHLPLATDSLIAEILARRLAEGIEETGVVMPVPPAGLSDHHLGFPGTVTLPETVLRGVVDAYVDALVRISVRDVFVFSAHGGNFGFLTRLAAAYRDREDVRLAVYDDMRRYFATTFAGARRAGFTPPETDWHAGGTETSQGLDAFPDLVRDFTGVEGYLESEDGWLDRVLADGVHAVSETGVLGSPQRATAAAGAAIFEALREELVGFVERVFGCTPLARATT